MTNICFAVDFTVNMCRGVVIPAKENQCLGAHVTFSDVVPGTSRLRVPQGCSVGGLVVSEVFGPDRSPLHPICHLSSYFLNLQTQPGTKGAFPQPLGLMRPKLGSPHSPGRWELVAWHQVGRPRAWEKVGINGEGRRIISPKHPSPSPKPSPQIPSELCILPLLAWLP